MSASIITYIICAYNEAQRIDEVLCVVATRPLLNEVIVVDGSTDNTADIVRSFPSMRLIFSAENRGKSRAFAEAVRAAKNDFIMRLDADLKHLTVAASTKGSLNGRSATQRFRARFRSAGVSMECSECDGEFSHG